MAIAELEDGRIVLDVPLREKALISAVPGAKWHDATKRWRAPLSWASCKALRGVFGDKLEVGPLLADWSWAEYNDRVEPSRSWRALALNPEQRVDGIDASLYPYQQTGVAFLAVSGSALLADEMGTGKTVQTSVALHHLQAWPALIVCPKSMQSTWAREIEKWAGKRATVLAGSAAQRRKQLDGWSGGALVATYDLIRTHSRLAGYGSMKLTDEEKRDKELNAVPWAAVVADEAHRAKEPKAKQTRALWALGDRAVHRFALTGTPIANKPDDLWAIMRFVSPDEWPSKTKFIDRYCSASYNHFGGLEVLGLNPQTEPELREILEPRFLRRPKALVLPFLPPKVYERRDIELSPKQAKAYRQMADGMVANLDSGQLTVFDPMIQAARLSQLASATPEIVSEELDPETGQLHQTVRLSEPSSKLDAFEEILEELGDAPCAAFAASRQLLDLAVARLEKRGIPFCQVVGGMSAAERGEAVDAYNAGRARVILISLGAGAEGMSLTRGTTEVFLDRSWSQLQNAQAEDRLHGTGRGEVGSTKLTIIDLIAVDTIEEFRAEALQEKSDRLEELVRDRDLLRAALTHGRKEKGRSK